MSDGIIVGSAWSCLKFITQILEEFLTPPTFSLELCVCWWEILFLLHLGDRMWKISALAVWQRRNYERRGHVSIKMVARYLSLEHLSGKYFLTFFKKISTARWFSKVWLRASEPEDSFPESSYYFCKSKHVKYIHNISFAHICLFPPSLFRSLSLQASNDPWKPFMCT